MQTAQAAAKDLLSADPELTAPENAEEESTGGEGEKLDWKEFIRSGSYDDIS